MAVLPIDGPISVNDVASTLGHPISYDVGTLCRHPNINKWAKYKPVRHNKLFDLNDGDFRSVNTGLLKYPDTTNYKLLIPSALMWFHNKPRGVNGFNEPYRLGDFRGYNSESTAPATSLPTTVMVNKTLNGLLTVQVPLRTDTTAPNSTQATIDDISISIGHLYYAVVFEWLGESYIKTAWNSIGTYSNSVSFNFNNEYPLNLMSPQDLQFYSVLSNTRITDLTLLSDISPAVIFSPLPLEDNGNNQTTVRLRTGSGLVIRLTKVNKNDSIADPWGPFVDIPYVPVQGTIVANSGLQFLGTIENYTDQDISLPSSGWEVRPSPTYWGNNSSNWFPVDIRASDGSYIAPTVVPANTTIDIGFSARNILNRDGANVVPVTSKVTEIIGIFIRNGNYTTNTSVHATSME